MAKSITFQVLNTIRNSSRRKRSWKEADGMDLGRSKEDHNGLGFE